MISILRQLVAARPFRPFRLVLTGGHEVPVSSPERIRIQEERESARVWTDDGHEQIIDLNHLIEVRS